MSFLLISCSLPSPRPASGASTRPPRDRAAMEPVRPFGLPGVPARHGPDRDRTGGATTSQASVLRLRRLREVPALMVAALRLQAAFAGSPGAIEMSLRAAPLRRTVCDGVTLALRRRPARLHRPRHTSM
jgi:hypothetical protein